MHGDTLQLRQITTLQGSTHKYILTFYFTIEKDSFYSVQRLLKYLPEAFKRDYLSPESNNKGAEWNQNSVRSNGTCRTAYLR